MRFTSFMVAVATAGMFSTGLSSPADAKSRNPHENVALVKGPAIQEITSPYRPALKCLATQLQGLPEEKRRMTFSAGEFPDRTGKFNQVAETGLGAFSTQGATYMLTTSLKQAGVEVVNSTAEFRHLVDWYQVKGSQEMVGDGIERILRQADGSARTTKSIPLIKGTLRPIDFYVTGAFTSLDTPKSGGLEGEVLGVGGGSRKHYLVIGTNLMVTQVPVGDQLGGEVVYADDFEKQIVGWENRFGIDTFVDHPSKAKLVMFNAGKNEKEALQRSQRHMIDVVAYTAVSRALGITACEELRQYGDLLASGEALAQPE